MSLLVALFIGVLAGSGVWLMLRARSFDAILGLTLFSYAVNLFIFAMGRLKVDAVPIIQQGVEATLKTTADPLPQALVLTAIVISFALTAVLLGIALRAARASGDHVDGAP
jgi:multicomponent K+:H+ antiporter subunit C